MQPFKKLTSIAAPLPLINVDTDMIVPKQFLRTILRTGLGKSLFHDMRYNDDETPKAGFVLNRAPFNAAQILVTGENFGCGSSREHAPWALLDFGIRCVIAPSYADIFYNNCFKNGILPVTLPPETVNALMERITSNPGETITVDLENNIVSSGNIRAEFSIDPFRRHCLLNGLDDIGLTMEKSKSISEFENNRKTTHPWL